MCSSDLKDALIRKYLDKIPGACHGGGTPADGKPCALHRDELERYLLLAGDLPGVKVSTVLSADPQDPNGTVLFVDVKEKLYDGYGRVSRRSSRFVGPYQGDAAASVNNVTGFGERTQVRTILAYPYSELNVYELVEEAPIFSEGTRIAAAISEAHSNPGDRLRVLPLATTTQSGSLTVTHPWIRARGENLSTRLTFTYRDIKTKQREAFIFEDRTRAFTFGSTYDFADPLFGVNLFDVSGTKGFDLGNTTLGNGRSPLSRASGTAEFSKVNGQASRLQSLGVDGLDLLIAGIGQYSFSQLLIGEEFSVGGEQFGRGYDSGEISGDHGAAGKLELRYFLPQPVDFVLSSMQAYTFYDIGRVWNVDTSRKPLTVTSIASLGIGLRFNVTESVSGYVEGTKALTAPVSAEPGKPYRFFFSVAARF